MTGRARKPPGCRVGFEPYPTAFRDFEEIGAVAYFQRCPLLFVLMLSIGGFVGACLGNRSVQAADSDVRDAPDITQLIEQLGSESYATRMRARESLQRIGLEAFDQLHLAQFHPDSEIAMSARFLISSLQVSWSKESDPPEVRETLLEYGGCDESERKSRIDRLAEFPHRIGLPALVRVTSYERSLRLSRHAALALMQQKMETDPAMRRRNAEQILEILGDNERQAADWLRVYAEDLESGEYSKDRWRELINQQRQKIDTASTREAARPSVLELVRVCATRAAKSGMPDEAVLLASQHSDLIPPTTRGLVEACSWAIDHGLHSFVLALRNQHGRMFDKQPILLYGAAEAEKVAGNESEADRLAARASQINPLPRNEQEKNAMQPKEIEETAMAHREIGNKLAERGLFHWAEREFRLIIDSLDLDSNPSAMARADLANLLGDLERHRDVVQLVRPLVERIQKDTKLKQQLIRMTRFNYSYLASLSDFHEAMDLIANDKADEAKPILASAFQSYPDNVDILIAMHRLDGDDAWRSLVQRTLQVTIRQLEQAIQDTRADAKRFGQQRSEYLGSLLNQYAWLVSNTEGDQSKALAYSQESLEIEMDGAKLDTCARCYYALGDLDNAIRVQKRALKLMPHSPPLLRQLAIFEKAKEGQSENEGSPTP
jgi:tetratricopeptide (TPR) repeat protein